MVKIIKSKLLKEKAVFMAFIIICTTFYIGLGTRDVNAQSSGNEACCEVTKNGDSCVFTDKNKCDTDFQVSDSRCEETSFCSNICCVDSSEGCFPNTPKGLCERKENTRIENDNKCNSLNECRSGCCVLGGEYFFTSEIQCKSLANNVYGIVDYDFNDVFKTGIDERACLELSIAQDEGCCVYGEACRFEEKSECKGNFKIGEVCSSLTECSECKPDFRKGCKDGNVYTFDSCGNTEELIEVCDYDQGTQCVEDDGNAFCDSLDCPLTKEYEHLNYTGGYKKHGESWCVYEGPTGDFTDRPGSRHYKLSCLNKEEIVDGCRDYRQEICIQADDKNNISRAVCLRNNIYDSEITSDISTVPVGFNFWEDNEENKEQCSEGSTSCTVLYVKKNRYASFRCEGNCHCETQEYLDKANQFCKSKGDCGFSYNILEKEGSSGFSAFWGGFITGSIPTTFSQGYLDYLKNFGIYGGMKGLSNIFKKYISSTETYERVAKDLLVYGLISLWVVSATGGVAAATGAVLSTSLGATAGLSAGASAAAAVTIVVLIIILVVNYLLGGGVVKTKTVTINCNPWQAPLGGDDCNKCTDDLFKECNEYRCKSLGTSCELINPESNNIKCIDSKPGDRTSPVLIPMDISYQGYTTAAKDFGYSINEQVDPFKFLTFGVNSDEFSSCRYDLEQNVKYDDMRFELGDGFFKKNHNISLVLEGNKEFKYFMKCTDIKGNKNNRDYAISFKTKKAPDLTAPIILDTSIKNNGVVASNITETVVQFMLNEPATCNYDVKDKSFDLMSNQSICDDEFSEVPKDYLCLAGLFELRKGNNKYYFRCRDLSGNINTQSYEFNLVRSNDLKVEVSEPSPEGFIFINDVTLSVETSGGSENGKSICRFSEEDLSFDNMIDFKITNSEKHLQSQVDLKKGNYDYFVKCKDSAGNEGGANIKFRVVLEGKGDEIVYTYKDASSLYVILNVASNCEYNDKAYVFGTGTKMGGEDTTIHTAPLDLVQYNIKCQDLNGKDVKGVVVNV